MANKDKEQGTDPFAEKTIETGADPFSPDKVGRETAGGDVEYDLSSLIQRIPEGTYTARLINIKDQESQNGNKMLVWEFVLMNGPAAGQTVSQFTSLTPQAMWKVSQTLAGLGLEGKFRKSEAINRLCLVNIVWEKYQNQDRDSLKEVLAYPEGAGMMWTPGAALPA